MKKTLCTLLALAMLLTLFSSNVLAFNSAVFKDVKSSDYYATAAISLNKKNILSGYPDGSFGADKSITRAEMAAIVCRMQGFTDGSSNNDDEILFNDVSSSHWALAFINSAAKMGIINGDGNGIFRPEDAVSHEEAIKMVVCTLGYEKDIENNPNDWSSGYLKKANQLGITANLKGTKGKASTRGDIAVMVYNGLTKTEDCGESIKISSSEEIYALSRILANSSSKTNYIYKTDVLSIEDDFKYFDIPAEIVGNNKKAEYLQSSSYELAADINLTLNIGEGKDFFIGIGSDLYPFKGQFNGKGHIVTITANDKIRIDEYCSTGLGLFGLTNNAKLSDINVKIAKDIVITHSSKNLRMGALVGNSVETEINRCTVSFINSLFGVDYTNSSTYANPPYVGGMVGISTRSIFNNCHIIMDNSSIMAKGLNYDDSKSMYAMFSVGGLIGFSNPGSDNSENIGRLGNQLYNCRLTSRNKKSRNIIEASVVSGQEICAGGLVGCTFNNFIAKNCSVDITSGNIVATKTGVSDLNSYYGAQSGGIIGRMEHTGELDNCRVTGNNLNILSTSPNNLSSAGGIAGISVGAYHRDVVSFNNCSFNGNKTSSIEVNITSKDESKKTVSAGGIVGNSYYKINNCSASNVTIINNSAGIANTSGAGAIAGWQNKTGLWAQGKYFTPKAPQISDCTYSGVNFDVSDNVEISSFGNQI